MLQPSVSANTYQNRHYQCYIWDHSWSSSLNWFGHDPKCHSCCMGILEAIHLGSGWCPCSSHRSSWSACGFATVISGHLKAASADCTKEWDLCSWSNRHCCHMLLWAVQNTLDTHWRRWIPGTSPRMVHRRNWASLAHLALPSRYRPRYCTVLPWAW